MARASGSRWQPSYVTEASLGVPSGTAFTKTRLLLASGLEQYSVTSTWDSATRFKSIPDVNGNVTMLNMTWSGNTYRLYIDDSY